MSKAIDLAGSVFGRLVALHSGIPAAGRRTWVCNCDCGRVTTVVTSQLTSGRTKSCGCLHREALVKSTTKHGKTRSAEYKIWLAMRERCSSPNARSYKYHGGRGISVCSEWGEFELFLNDMGTRPSPKHTIERINNDSGYSPDNCIWATRAVQNRNTRRNVFIAYKGKTLCLSEWAREVGIPPSRVAARYGLGERNPSRLFSAGDLRKMR